MCHFVTFKNLSFYYVFEIGHCAMLTIGHFVVKFLLVIYYKLIFFLASVQKRQRQGKENLFEREFIHKIIEIYIRSCRNVYTD